MIRLLCYIINIFLLSLLLCGSVKGEKYVQPIGVELADAIPTKDIQLTDSHGSDMLLHFHSFVRINFVSFLKNSHDAVTALRNGRAYYYFSNPTWAVSKHKPLYIVNRILLI